MTHIPPFWKFFLLCIALASAQRPPGTSGDDEEEKKEYAGTYMVVSPSVVRPGRPFAVSLNILKPGTDYIARVEIRNGRNQTLETKIERDVKYGKPITVRIDQVSAETLVPGDQYHVYVKGESVGGKLHFEARHDIRFDPKSLSIFVQTDKAVYKPGALVNFRVIVIKPDLKPFKQKIKIKLSDPNQNVVKQWLDAPLKKGVSTQSLQLSDDPPLGDWKISVQTKTGVKFDKTFSVEKYVLPKFEVTIDPPAVSTIKDDVVVTVKAKYTYGKGVEGSARLIADEPWSFHQNKKAIQKTKKMNKEGEAVFRFTNKELRQSDLVNNYGYNQIKFTATVTEGLTGIERNDTNEITVHKHDVKVEATKTMETFKPGLSYKLIIAVKRQDDTPIPDDYPRKVKLDISYSFPYDIDKPQQEPKTENRLVRLDRDGTKIIELTPPIGVESLSVSVVYDKKGKDNFKGRELYNSIYVDAAKSPTNTYLQLLSTQDEVQAGSKIRFTLKATEDIKIVTMQVMSRGTVVLSKEIAMNGDTHSIQFTTTSEMAPKSRLIVYAIREDNKEILVDAMDFKVTGLFRNEVKLSLDKKKAKPAEKVKVRVKAERDSFVGLLAVDQSVLLLKSGNDITSEMVENDIEQYDTTFGSGHGPHPWIGPPMFEGRRKRSSWYPWWGIGGKDAYTIFENAGLVVLTDAFLYREPQRPMPLFERKNWNCVNCDGEILLSALPPMEVADGGQIPIPRRRAAPTTAKLRTKFPETWIWENTIIR